MAEDIDAVFCDISHVCVHAVGTMLVLQNPISSALLFPQVGYMVQERRKWVWKPMWNPAGLLVMTIDEDDQPRRSKLSMQELWKLWLEWCVEVVYCSIEDCWKESARVWITEFARQIIAPDNSESGVAFKGAFGRFVFSSERHQEGLMDDYTDIHDWALYALFKALVYKNTTLGHMHRDALAQPDKAALMVLELNPAPAGPDPECVDSPVHSCCGRTHSLASPQ
ncbi:hypothetical protein V8D89_003676 [Ganoderma adspersum]